MINNSKMALIVTQATASSYEDIVYDVTSVADIVLLLGTFDNPKLTRWPANEATYD